MRLLAVALLLATPFVVARGARAQQEAGSTSTTSSMLIENEANDSGDWLLRRKHTLAELELGVIALPTAPISAGQSGGNLPGIGQIGKGDTTALLGLHFFYRGGREWMLGAGAMFAPRPTSDDTYGGASGLSRTHSRSYLSLGVEGRYIPLHWRTLEGWVGISVGGVVIADRFITNAGDQVPPILGTKEVTVRTEGYSVGVSVGGDYLFAERFLVGVAGRLNHWILPASPGCTPIGDCATLTGPVSEIELGIRLGYRIPL